MAKAQTEPGKKVRATLFIDPVLIDKLDKIARREAVQKNEPITRTDVVNEGLGEYVSKYEKKNGAL